MTFKYGLGEDFIDVLKTLHKVGLDRTDKVRVGALDVAPRDVVAAVLPDPATLVENEWSMREYGSQAVVWQAAINPVVALELLAAGAWSGAGVLGPEAFEAAPFLDLLEVYGSPSAIREG